MIHIISNSLLKLKQEHLIKKYEMILTYKYQMLTNKRDYPMALLLLIATFINPMDKQFLNSY